MASERILHRAVGQGHGDGSTPSVKLLTTSTRRVVSLKVGLMCECYKERVDVVVVAKSITEGTRDRRIASCAVGSSGRDG